MTTTLVLVSSLLLFVSGCSAGKEGTGGMESMESTEELKGEYKRISAQAAKEMIDSGEEPVILDVRTQAEYDEGHIEGAVLLPYDEIDERAAEFLPDKNTKILVYCRSGNRSAIASHALIALGYTDVTDFGGIISWPYEVVTD
jgi:rhodanese-related sulfurtransferase